MATVVESTRLQAIHNRYREDSKKEWAMLIYVAAENNLSDNVLPDLKELCKVGSTPHLHIGLEVDMKGTRYDSMRYEVSEPDWTGQAHLIEVEELKEQDSGKPETLMNFLQWGFRRYCAQKYMVVIWGHGSGFKGKVKNVASDYETGNALDMTEIEGVFRALFNSDDYKGYINQIEILGFDACLMNMLEVSNHFKGIAKYIIGSQQTIPGSGWFYNRVINTIDNSKATSVIAQEIVKEYIDGYMSKGRSNVTQSAIDLAKTAVTTQCLHQLGAKLAPYVKKDGVLKKDNPFRNKLLALRSKTLIFDTDDYIDADHFIDLLQKEFTAEISSEEDRDQLQGILENFQHKLYDCILENGINGGNLQNAKGLSIWFPSSATNFKKHRAQYLRLQCNYLYEQRGWVDFLDAFHFQS